MKKLLYDAKEEIKRADHLIYVSLKYTRTVDMFRHILKRIINSLDFTIDALLKYAKKKKKIKEMPTSPVMKGNIVKEIFSDHEKIIEMVNFYLFLRKVIRAKYTKAREYRRHVTMAVVIEEGPVEINIDIIHEYFDKIKEYIAYTEELIFGKNE